MNARKPRRMPSTPHTPPEKTKRGSGSRTCRASHTGGNHVNHHRPTVPPKGSSTEETKVRVGTALVLLELVAHMLEELPGPETAIEAGDPELWRYLRQPRRLSDGSWDRGTRTTWTAPEAPPPSATACGSSAGRRKRPPATSGPPFKAAGSGHDSRGGADLRFTGFQRRNVGDRSLQRRAPIQRTARHVMDLLLHLQKEGWK